MPRFADSKEIVANEDVEPIDEQYRKYLKEVEHRLPTLRPSADVHYLVYRTINIVNGNSYTGCHKTKNKDDGYMGSGKLLILALKKYGPGNFRKEILFEAVSSEDMFAKEKELVVVGPGSYNLKQGGHGGWDHVDNRGSRGNLGAKWAPEKVIEQSIRMKGKPSNHKGWKYTEEQNRANSLRQIGIPKPRKHGPIVHQ